MGLRVESPALPYFTRSLLSDSLLKTQSWYRHWRNDLPQSRVKAPLDQLVSELPTNQVYSRSFFFSCSYVPHPQPIPQGCQATKAKSFVEMQSWVLQSLASDGPWEAIADPKLPPTPVCITHISFAEEHTG